MIIFTIRSFENSEQKTIIGPVDKKTFKSSMEPKDLNDGVEEAGNENNVKDLLIVILKRKNEEIL